MMKSRLQESMMTPASRPSSQRFPAAARTAATLAAVCAALLLAACGTPPRTGGIARQSQEPAVSTALPASDAGNEVAFYALSLIDTGYSFGGKNPSAGLDCSGMVSYIFREAGNVSVTGSAADIARKGREINPRELRAGDLVFFNTMNKPFSHVGIYIGNGRFVHAPSTNGKVHISRLDNPYFSQRFEMARSYFN